MAKEQDKNLLVGLDIGTSKIVALVGEPLEDGKIRILGCGQAESRGLRKGVVNNIESTVQAIRRAVEQAEQMAGCEIHSLVVSISGSHIKSLNSHGMVAIKGREVSLNHMDQVIEAASAVPMPSERRLLHVLPQEYMIDQQDVICNEPIGMSGMRLDANVHIVSCSETAAQNVTKCVELCGLKVERLVVAPVASAHSVLDDDEKNLGVCLVDIGAGTTDIVVYTGGAVRYTAVQPFAGDLVTNDIAYALRTSSQNAESIKKQYACALRKQAGMDDTIEVPSLGEHRPQRMRRQTLAEVVEPRYEEIFLMIQEDLRQQGFEERIASVVLTGGASQIEGAVELAREIFHRQVLVRVGLPAQIEDPADLVSNPMYATAVGLLMFSQDQNLDRSSKTLTSTGMGVWWGRFKNWIRGEF